MTVKSGIRGISEERRTPRIGKVRLGVQEPNSSGHGTHPVMTDHFVFDRDTPAGDMLYKLFGESCRSLPIAFPSDDPREFARRNLEMWGAATLKCKGDGETAEALVNVAVYDQYRTACEAAGGAAVIPPENLWASTARAGAKQREQAAEPERRAIPCLGLGYDGAPPCPKFDAPNGCGASMHLTFIIRTFPGLGTFQLDTGSVTNIQRIDDFLEHLGKYTGGRYAGLPLVMHLEPYQMKGRTFYGLRFDVDFAAMQVQGLGALPGVAQLTVGERITRYLPPETQDAPLPALTAGSVVDDEAPSDRVIEGAIVEPPAAQDHDEADPPRGWDRRNATDEDEQSEPPSKEPVGNDRMNDALLWLDEMAKAAKCTRRDVLEALNADIVEVAMDLDGMRERWAQLHPTTAKSTAAPAAARGTQPQAADVKARPMLRAWAKQALGLSESDLLGLCGIESIEELDDIAEREGGWPQAAAWVEAKASGAAVPA